MYNLRFLGGVSVKDPEGPVVGPAVQARRLAFLACLAVTRGEPVSRDKLIALLWPESAPESARHAVSDTVYVLNHALEDAPVEVVGNGLRIDPERCPSDVATFQTAIESGDLERAVAVYGGGFLDGLFLKDALEFEQWAREERDRFARAYAQALEELAEHATQRGDHRQAVSWWRDLVAHDPYSGRATVRLMESLAAAGDRAEALRQADAHAVRMREEFDAAPDPAVTEFGDRLRAESMVGVKAGEPVIESEIAKARPWPIRHGWLSLAVTALVTVLGVWYVMLRDAEPGPEEAAASIDAHAIAVLPFSVQGEEVAVLREGMVDLLSTGLDGAGGLRTIPVGTLMTRWRESVVGEEPPELTAALGVARRTTAQYALVGSVVEIDSDVRIVVDVYDAHTSERLGQSQVDGSPHDVLPLVDRLAVEVLAIILEKGEEQIPPIQLASFMSDTTAALKAYLEGRAHHRRFDLVAAEKAYQQAVEADSAFALAHYQLSNVYGWGDVADQTLSNQHAERAMQLAGRLPSREALFVRSAYAPWRQSIDALEPLRERVQTYPDDAEAWYRLGEMLAHIPAVMGTPEEIEEAFDRAVELDPRNAPHLSHYVGFAWSFHGDSALAEERVAMLERVRPDTKGRRRLALDLAFGDSAAQREAMTQLRTHEDWQVIRNVYLALFHPRHAAFQPLARLLLERGDDFWSSLAAARLFSTNATWYGRLQEALPYLDNPAITADRRAEVGYRALAIGLPVPDEALERALGSALIDSVAESWTIFYAGAYAADRGRWSDHGNAIAELKRRAQRSFAGADSASGVNLTGGALALEGYGLWRQGDPVAALPMLEDPTAIGFPWYVVKLWLAQLYHELDRLQDAQRVYCSYDFLSRLSTEPLAQRELGKIYEQLEEYDEALESYEYFVHYWQDADPELQPLVEEARQAIIRVEGLRRQ